MEANHCHTSKMHDPQQLRLLAERVSKRTKIKPSTTMNIPSRVVSYSSVYSFAALLGYAYIGPGGRRSADGQVWLVRHLRDPDDLSDFILVGYADGRFVVEG